MGCLDRSRDDWTRRSMGAAGSIIFWISCGSIIMASVYRENCTVDSSIVPMLLLPTGIMGVFTSATFWFLVSYLWYDDAFDPMKLFAYVSSLVTWILQFVTFGFAFTKMNHHECQDPFIRYAVASSFVLAVILSVFIVLYVVNKRKSGEIDASD